jgi:hypothetical protein
LPGLENLPDSGIEFDTGPAKAFNRKDRKGSREGREGGL